MRLFSRLAASHSLRCSAGHSVSSSLQRSLSTLTVDRWDLVDFRLRALRRLRGEVRETHATLSEHERHRWQQLGSENKLDWTLPETLSGVERVLGGPVHVEKDKHIVRELLKLSVQKAPSHRLVQMFRSVSPDGESTQSQCFQFLMNLGVITPDTNPCVLRHEEPLFFSPQVLAEVPRLQQLDAQHDVDRHIRQDLRSLPALTIDAPNASEIDDAVSVGPDGWIYIHVADPNRLIEPRSLLDRYAARRAVSVFLPEKTFPLLPSKISTEMLSINPGKQTRVLTFGARIADDGRLLEHKVFVALLQNVHKGKCGKVSYRGADEVLAGSTTHGAPAEVVKALQTLNRYAVTRRKYRESRGATIVQLPEPVLRIQNGGKVSLVLDNKESASRSLVEEMMILGGQVAAEYAKKHQIPMPYRVQEASEPQNSTSASSARASAPVKAASSNSNAASGSFVARVMAAAQQTGSQKPAFMDTIPRRHASIGLDAYVQVTSPIRRYCDLLAHHQLKSHLRCPSDPLPFSSYDILTYRDVYESSVRQVEALQQSSVRYWLLKHLEERNAAAAPLKALILPRPGSASLLAGDVVNVFLMDFAFRVFTKLVRPHEYGDIISVNITRIDSIMLALDVIET